MWSASNGGTPTNRKCKDVVGKKLLPNWPITTYDINNENYIFGTDLVGVRVKAVIKKLSSANTEEYVNIPEYFYKIHEFLTLTADVMFVSENMFMITPESKLKFMKVEYLPSQTA